MFMFFLVIATGAPLLDSQTIFPSNIFPEVLVQLKTWYTNEYGDYLFSEKPHFFIGLVWLHLFFAWPLSVLSLYGIVARKSWLPTTCLLYGVSTLTSMVFLTSLSLFFLLLSIGNGLNSYVICKLVDYSNRKKVKVENHTSQWTYELFWKCIRSIKL